MLIFFFVKDDSALATAGKILCDRPLQIGFDESRIVQKLFSENDDRFDQDEIDSMPSKFSQF